MSVYDGGGLVGLDVAASSAHFLPKMTSPPALHNLNNFFSAFQPLIIASCMYLEEKDVASAEISNAIMLWSTPTKLGRELEMCKRSSVQLHADE